VSKENTEDLLLLALFGAAAYVIYQVVSGTGAALASVGNAIGSGLYEAFNPNVLGQTAFLTVAFPDGTSHTVASGLIQGSSGSFTVPINDSSGVYVTPAVSQQYGGNTYTLVQSPGGTGYTAIQQGSLTSGSSVPYTPGASVATDVYTNVLAAGI
jgi:hypothetical protein